MYQIRWLFCGAGYLVEEIVDDIGKYWNCVVRGSVS